MTETTLFIGLESHKDRVSVAPVVAAFELMRGVALIVAAAADSDLE
jgi:hypothetical protein